jgi:hypothetical protein
MNRPKDTLLFVDEVAGTTARLLLGEQAFTIPARLLPKHTREGAWVTLTFAPAPAPAADDAATAALRRKLAEQDDGGDIKL